jgi:tRNA (cytidine32/uridine32-2'-O)-methyltransferase
MTEETLEQMLATRFVVVLNRTQDIVNIAGTLRAMMNMGLERLRLVRPDLFNAYRIAGIAHGAEPLLERVEFFDSLREAITDVGLVVGTTARRRTATYVWHHPRDAAPDLLQLARTMPSPIALVFGREDTGLLNDEIDLCDRLLVVPAHPSHPSLNLAQAVLLVLYELRLAALAETPELPNPKRRAPPATTEELQMLFADAERTLERIEFFKSRHAHMIMRSLRAITRRARPNSREVKLLRGIAIEVRKFLNRKLGSED